LIIEAVALERKGMDGKFQVSGWIRNKSIDGFAIFAIFIYD